ncbi:hypothetical protein K432DRAFT_429304 [Lepidopterella palustris CBS 459.81]|uniref:BTB domain-containing protein n=1 Tax=Lepidopterella palustris CBS 459.81 TaxID=1314670 RepID=A0A8E2E1G0_9PEZI|nr:hypothetical protein K432DRAFT_429304 [Lepidopterella palustris CBS 459.81]
MLEASDLTVIAPAGDIVLDVCHGDGPEHFSYRVESEFLRQASRYFEALLSNRFNEGARVATEHAALKASQKYASFAETPADELPQVAISDIGRISKVHTIKDITADFLRALHGFDVAVPNPPMSNIANLAIVADRFDALPYFSKYVRQKKYLQRLDILTKTKLGPSLAEERVRQKLLIGVLLNHAPWVTKFSKQLIMNDSVRWKPQAQDDHGAALWWDIPQGVEDEMIQRREYVLETINSLQLHFLKLYTSGERQCKLGYDSSLQCDSFQLGEMIRFFVRHGILRLQGTIYDTEPPPRYSGSIDRLLESFRQCSEYQVDRNHTHCGLRARLIPLLDHIQNQLGLDAGSIDVGICAECWNNSRGEYAWAEAKRPLVWTRSRLSSATRSPISVGDKKSKRLSQSSCLTRHLIVRDMFTAVERDWTAKDAY